MKLPDRVPTRLREAALPLSDLDDGEAVWTRDDAIAVIDSLKGTTIAVSDVVFIERVAWGYEATETTLTIGRIPNESDPDYARRSRARAREFITATQVEGERWLVALTFPVWKDAA